MIPIRVCLQGFMSYRDRAELCFEGSSLWMLTGDNGAGKSVVFDAVTYVLYGFHRFGDNKNYGELINKNSNGEMLVEFDFAVDRDLFRVKRTYNRKGRATFQAWKCLCGYGDGDVIEDYEKNLVAVDGTEKEKGFYEWVREIIGLDKHAFPAAVLLRQGKTDALLAAEPSDRHPILAQIVDLSRYQKLYARADEHRKRFKSDAERLKTKLENCPQIEAAQIGLLEEKIEVAKNDREKAARRCDDLIELRVRAEQWEKLIAEKAALEEEIRRAESLFASGEQIENDAFEADELKDVLPVLEKLFDDRRRLEKLNEQKREYENLDAEIVVLQKSVTDSEAASRAFPLWQNYCRSRSEWRSAEETAEQLNAALEKLGVEISQTETELEEMEGSLTEVGTRLDESKNALDRAKIKSENAREKNRRFSELQDAAVCDWCGQQLTEHHRAAESTRLEKDLRDAESNLKTAQSAHCSTLDEWKELNNERSECAERLENLRDEKKDAARNLESAEGEQKRAIQNASENLSALQEINSSPLSALADVEGCFAHEFPQPAELDDMRRQSGLYANQKKRFDGKRNERDRLSSALGQLAVVAENVDRHESSLPDRWRQRSSIITAEDLRELRAKAEALKDANQKLEDLREARRKQQARQSRCAEIESEIERINVQARCAPSEIALEEKKMRLSKAQAEEKLKAAEEEKRDLENQQANRCQLEEDWGEAAHKYELYKELAKHLGADYLQRQLLQDAEKSIVTYANRFLDRVSGSSLRLELKTNDSTEATSAAKALDLKAYYDKAGAESLPINALSGGQRFRVAVSLALGIGQYASGGTRRLESVIIDEGFGSLDRGGRNEMISELHQLKNELRRIIIISHQEEVAQVFANNKFWVEHTDGSSRVKLVDGFE